MLTPTQIAQIETLASQGMPFKRIQRMTGISRNTIKKYVHRANEPLTERQKVRNALDKLKPVIQRKFFAAEGNCAVVCRQMKDEHQICINERRMRRFCSSWREELKCSGKKYERYETQPGQHLQIDFGERDVAINGATVRVHIFVAILGYSRRIFVKAYIAENQAAWFDGIESAFTYYGGIPLAIVSDNSRCLVNEHHNGLIKWNERYESLCAYWKIKPIACRGYHPEGKGKIERAVRYVKGNALVGKDFGSLSELNRWLERWCLTVADEREIKGLFEGPNTPKKRFWIEKGKLMKLEQPRTMRLREETRKVDKTGLIQVDGRHYRVPDEYSQKDVQILMDDHSIMVYRKGDFVIELDKETSVYMPTLQRAVDPNKDISYQINQAYCSNPWIRSGSVYDSVIQGGE